MIFLSSSYISGRAARQALVVALGIILSSPFASAAAQAPVADTIIALPVRFEAGRVFVRPVTSDGDTLQFFTDTGGGANMLFAGTATRLGIAVEQVVQGSDTFAVAPWPTFRPKASIPPPALDAPPGDRMLVTPAPSQGPMALVFSPDDAGVLGRTWFADRVWTFDYPGERLLLRPRGDLGDWAEEHRVPLGFRVDASGRRMMHFPRIQIAVEGRTIDMLFDTGATTVLTDSARLALNDGGPARRATSFISASVFDRWRAEHPGWRVLEAAEAGTRSAMIEVPSIDLAGHRIGPVWFTRRPDAAFRQWMSQWMDEPVDGALGGSALQFCRFTIDYPNAAASFARC